MGFGPAQGAVGGAVGTSDIEDGAVTLSKMADVATATFLGRDTAGTGPVEALTAAEAAALLPVFTGDSGSGGVKGLVPAPAAGDAAAGAYLDAAGGWSVPAGGGGGGAPTTADYLVKTANVGLSAERVVTDGTFVTWDWSVAGQAKATIPDAAITYAKIQNVSATDKLLGRSTAGAGVVEEITCTAAGRALLDDAAATNQLTTLGLSANGKSLVTAADYAAMRALLDLEAGTDFLSPAAIAAAYQPLDATLTALAGLTIAANTLTIGTGADAFSQVAFAANKFPARSSAGNLEAKSITDFALTLLDDADAATARATLGVSDSFRGALVGNGVDGPVTYSADTTLTADVYATDIVVDAAKVLTTNNFTLYATGDIDVNGTIRCNGGDGGAGLTDGTAGAGGAAAASASWGGGYNGAAGGAGDPGFGNGANGNVVETPYTFGSAVGSAGGDGGAGTATTGGTAGAGTTGVGQVAGRVRLTPVEYMTGVGVLALRGGAGGASGGAGGGDGMVNVGAGGGGGGAGGGTIAMFCGGTLTVDAAGAIEAKGGAGGNGGDGAGGCGGGGGGAGGSGGYAQFVYGALANAGSISVAGGAAGSGGAAPSGTPGSNGSAGGTGKIVKFNLSTGAYE